MTEKTRSNPRSQGFTLIELIIAITIVALLATLAIPAFNAIANAGGITSASYEISGAIENARAYAMSHGTYTWVGFFEEDGNSPSLKPAQAGVGRVVISVVASSDGSIIYDPAATVPVLIDPTRLSQVCALIRVKNVHLSSFSNGSGTGTTFTTRPALASANAKVGITSPPSGSLPYFQYPVGSPAPSAQYTFQSVLQLSPRGEVLVNTMSGNLTPLVEVGLQPVHGNVVDAKSSNLIALQISGISGNVIQYRQ